MLAVLESLKKIVNSDPERVEKEAATIYGYVKSVAGIGLFDERDYFLGEAALIAGNGCRLTGRYEEAENWLDLADISFRHTINSSPLLTRAYPTRDSFSDTTCADMRKCSLCSPP